LELFAIVSLHYIVLWYLFLLELMIPPTLQPRSQARRNVAVVNLEAQFAQAQHDDEAQAQHNAAAVVDAAARQAAAQAEHEASVDAQAREAEAQAQRVAAADAQAALDAAVAASHAPARVAHEPAPHACQQHGRADDLYDPDFAAKLALYAWLQSADPPRLVPRPSDFFDKIVENLWEAEVRAASDIASLEVGDVCFASATARGFFKLVAHPAACAEWPQSVVSQCAALQEPAGATVELLQQMQAQQFKMFSQLGAKQAAPTVSVDLQKALEGLGLDRLAHDTKPHGEAVDKLAARAEKLTKKQKQCNFVAQSVAPFLPPHARNGTIEAESDDEQESETVKALAKLHGVKKTKPTLSFVQTLEALFRYVLAGAATKQFSLADGLNHFGVVLRVAGQAKRHSAAVAYDQRVREKWANLAFQAGSGSFDLSDAMSKLDEQVYKEVAESDGAAGSYSQNPHQAPTARGSVPKPTGGQGVGKVAKFTGTCNHCGKVGHRKLECYAFLKQQGRGAERFDPGAVGEPDNKRRKRYQIKQEQDRLPN